MVLSVKTITRLPRKSLNWRMPLASFRQIIAEPNCADSLPGESPYFMEAITRAP